MASKKILLIIILSAFSLFGTAKAQDKSEKNKLTRKEKKEYRKHLLEIKKDQILRLLNSRRWVIEAHLVFDKYNQSYQISPLNNFVSIEKDQGSVQLGFNNLIGWSGVGGITIDGSVKEYNLKVKKNKSNPILIMRLSGKGVGYVSLYVVINAAGQANGRISGDFGSRIAFQGRIVPIEASQVFKGRSTENH